VNPIASRHRIQWIDACIRQGRHPGIPAILERFEISRRQALRDIEYMRDSLGAPIAYCPKRRGYYYTDDSFAVPGQLMTADQRELLSCLAANYEVLAQSDTRATEAYTALAELLQRLSGKAASAVKLHHIPGDGVVPFRAILRPESAGKMPHRPVPSTLRRFYRGRTELQADIFEFYDSYEFIPALLASGMSYTIEHPKWLKSRLLQFIERMRNLNSG
jgi:predicted DNA-binding transcriptional regulator YafY